MNDTGVQVKSKASLAEFSSYQQQCGDMPDFARFYFVVHTPLDDLEKASTKGKFELWLPGQVAHLAVKYGLAEWIIGKAR